MSIRPFCSLLSISILAFATGCQPERATLLCTASGVSSSSEIRAGVYPNSNALPAGLEQGSVRLEDVTLTLDLDDSTDQPSIPPNSLHVVKEPLRADKRTWIVALEFPNRPVRIVATAPGCEPLKWDYDPEGTDLAKAGGHLLTGFRAFVFKKKPAKQAK